LNGQMTTDCVEIPLTLYHLRTVVKVRDEERQLLLIWRSERALFHGLYIVVVDIVLSPERRAYR
jgi:hypothetical protein